MNVLFNMNKIRFVELDEVFKGRFRRRDEISFFINLENIYSQIIANQSLMKRIENDSKDYTINITAQIINLISHYRLYFKKRGLNNKIYVYSPNINYIDNYTNRQVLEYYRVDNQYKYTHKEEYLPLTNILKESIPILQLIVQYLEGVYFIMSDSFEPYIIPYVMRNDEGVNIIFSNNDYDLQYVNHDFLYLYNRFRKPKVVDKHNIFNHLINDKTGKYKHVEDLSSSYILPVISTLGDKHRGLEKIKGYGKKTLCKKIKESIDRNTLPTSFPNATMFANVLISEPYKETFLNNFRVNNLESQSFLVTEKQKHGIYACLIDKFDNVSLKKINDDIFFEHPIQLEELNDIKFDNKDNGLVF